MRKVIKVSLAVMTASCWSLASSAQDGQPSLSETLAWMDSTFNPHEGGSFGYGVEDAYVGEKLSKRRTETFTYDGCTMTLHIQDDPNTPLYSEGYTSTLYTFNLRDIDPTSIKTWQQASQFYGLSCDLDPTHQTCDTEEMEFQTRNKEPLIDEETHAVFRKLKGSDRESSSKRKTFVIRFFFNDVQYAGRFVSAFRHAVTLCGGKKSTF
jgi:hypothetical protein